ncbi:MAG: hypothetical protein K6348_02165 [Deferribacterales bacterium]
MSLIYGGDEVFANSRHIYDVLAEKVDSGIKTNFLVYSISEDAAKEEVTLNGWKVISVKKLSKGIELQKGEELSYKESSKLNESPQTKKSNAKKSLKNKTIQKSDEKKSYNKKSELKKVSDKSNKVKLYSKSSNDCISNEIKLNLCEDNMVYFHDKDYIELKRNLQKMLNKFSDNVTSDKVL